MAKKVRKARKPSAKKVTLKPTKKGQKPITFQKGKLHRALDVPEGEPIPMGKRQAALRGDYGPKAKKEANFAFKGPLAKGRETRKTKKG